MKILVIGDLILFFLCLLISKARGFELRKKNRRRRKKKMDSKKIVSVFFFLSALLILFHESHGRPLSLGSPAPLSSPAPGPSNEWCWFLSTSCRNGSLTACIDPSSTGVASKELLLLVKNDGEIPLDVNVTTISFAKNITQIPVHQIEKVYVPVNSRGDTSIQVVADNVVCVIEIGPSASGGGIFDYILFATHMKVAYWLLLTGLIVIGITWACRKRQQGDGIPYQGLEMAHPDSPSANNKVETSADGWEQDWDGDWDELKSKAGGGHQMANGSANGLASRLPKREGRKVTRDD
ncbi:hypothetical protein PTKIN_Ptkin01aG0261100 [Pterospermum kingtungense]